MHLSNEILVTSAHDFKLHAYYFYLKFIMFMFTDFTKSIQIIGLRSEMSQSLEVRAQNKLPSESCNYVKVLKWS